MKKRMMVIGLLVVMGCMLGIGAAPVCAADLNLVGLLIEKLGVTTEQAEGGAGAIFDVASKSLSADDFAKVTDALPDVKSLLASDTSSGSETGSLKSLSSLLGKNQSSLSSLAGLSDTFSSLGLGSDMVSKYISIVLEYAQSKGGSEIANLLKSVLQ